MLLSRLLKSCLCMFGATMDIVCSWSSACWINAVLLYSSFAHGYNFPLCRDKIVPASWSTWWSTFSSSSGWSMFSSSSGRSTWPPRGMLLSSSSGGVLLWFRSTIVRWLGWFWYPILAGSLLCHGVSCRAAELDGQRSGWSGVAELDGQWSWGSGAASESCRAIPNLFGSTSTGRSMPMAGDVAPCGRRCCLGSCGCLSCS